MAKATILVYFLVFQAFFSGFYTGASAAPGDDLLVSLGQTYCAPQTGDRGEDGSQPAHRADLNCLAHCLATIGSATPKAGPALADPVDRLLAQVDILLSALAPAQGVARAGHGARAPPLPSV